jgi:transcriptional activator of cad operon
MEGDFRVGEWLVRPDLNRIERQGQEKSIESKVMDVLVYLAHHANQVLPKERIIQAIWPDTFVGDEVLSRAIGELWKALGDDAHSAIYIETISRRVYHLTAPVFRSAPISLHPEGEPCDVLSF